MHLRCMVYVFSLLVVPGISGCSNPPSASNFE